MEKHFISKLTDADGEQYETQHWVESAGDCCYFSKDQVQQLISDLEEIGRMLNDMINKADQFCTDGTVHLHEEGEGYFAN